MPSELLPGDRCPVTVLAIYPVPLDPHGGVAPPVVAAKRLIRILTQTRTVSGESGNQSGGGPGNQSGAPSNKRDPLGELVSVNVELAGLQGQPVLLSWSMFPEGGHAHLFGNWLKNVAAYRLEATTNDDTGTLEMWIPLPKPPGPYFIHLSLTTLDGASLTSMDSGPFG
jgi:hypothetical protein